MHNTISPDIPYIMAKNKTAETTVSVDGYVRAIDDKIKREDSVSIIEMMKSSTGFDPKMWGPSIIGFGTHHYKYESGREGDMPRVAFSPRKSAIVFYLGSFDKREAILEKLGKHTTGKGCIYVKKLDDIDVKVLKEMIKLSAKRVIK